MCVCVCVYSFHLYLNDRVVCNSSKARFFSGLDGLVVNVSAVDTVRMVGSIGRGMKPRSERRCSSNAMNFIV